MNMTKQNKIVEKNDLIPLDLYEKNRKQFRKKLVEFKKNRRIPLGPYATFYFESFFISSSFGSSSGHSNFNIRPQLAVNVTTL